MLGILVLGWAYRRVRAEFRARNRVERVIELLLIAASCVAILTTIGIFLSVFVEALRFFQQVSLLDFLFGFPGARRPRFAPIKSGPPALSVRSRCLRARC